MLTDKEILEPLRDWILSYPYTTPVLEIGIDYGTVDRSDRQGEGNALQLSGRMRLKEQKTVTGRVVETWRINFAIVIWRDTNDPELHRQISEFILQFISWVSDEQRKRNKPTRNQLLPTFSDTDYEVLLADGGGATALLDVGRTEFQIGLHLDYQIVY